MTTTSQQMISKLADQYYEMNLNPPPAEPTINDFVPRYRQYQNGQANLEKFIKDLMIHCESVENKYNNDVELLAQQLRNTQLDYEDAVNSRREHQARIKDLENKLNFMSQDNTVLKHRNPYVLVLIDGDGLIFKDDYVRQGLDGGKKAAYALRQAVTAQYTNGSEDIEIVAKIVANLTGLSRAMKRDNAIDNENDLREFMVGFTQAMSSFDFVDVGYGKERADSKIQDTARFHLRNYNCKQILLGVSHDAGYAPFLDSALHDETARKRVAVLEGYPTVKEILATGVDLLSFDALFRSDKLMDRTATNSSSSTPRSGHAVLSYATITQKASPPPQITLPLGPKVKNANTRVVAPKSTQSTWNPGPRGLDPVIPLNLAVLDQVKRRKDSDKLCNNHYLRGPCTKGDDCCFEHHYKPNQDEIRAIQFLARLNPCTSGQECDVDNCIYGHHCPSVKDGVCTHPYCKFQVHEHPPGTKLTKISKKGHDS